MWNQYNPMLSWGINGTFYVRSKIASAPKSCLTPKAIICSVFVVAVEWIYLLYVLLVDNRLIGRVGRVFANGPGDLGSIPGRVIPKTLKMVLDTSLLNTQQYKVRIKGKWNNTGKGVAPAPTPQCSCYWKGSLLVTLDYSRQFHFYCVFHK